MEKRRIEVSGEIQMSNLEFAIDDEMYSDIQIQNNVLRRFRWLNYMLLDFWNSNRSEQLKTCTQHRHCLWLMSKR